MSRAKSSKLTMRVEGDLIIVESMMFVYTLTIGATYRPNKPAASRVFTPAKVVGVAHADPERPDSPRLIVQRPDSRQPKPYVVWASSIVNTYNVPCVDKRRPTTDTQSTIDDLRREIAELRALIKH